MTTSRTFWRMASCPLVLVIAGCVGSTALPQYPNPSRAPAGLTQAKPVQPAPEASPEEGRAPRGPHLIVKPKIIDQDGNDVLEGNEQVVLSVDIENVGDRSANGLTLEVAGSPVVVRTLQERKYVGDIAPGWKKAVVMTGILPESVAEGSVDLEVRLLEAEGTVVSRASVGILLGGRAATVLPGRADQFSPAPPSRKDLPPSVRRQSGTVTAAVVIGISRYKGKGIPAVKYARRDAEAVASYLQRVGGVPAHRLKLLVDERATLRSVTAALEEWLPRQVTAQSTVFVYFAGHGTQDKSQERYLAPSDIDSGGKGRRRYPLLALYGTLLKLPTKNVIVVLDASFSGGGDRSLPSEPVPLRDANERTLPLPAGLTVLAASETEQPASDYDKALHGLFTYYLLKGFQGAADVDRNGLIDVGECFAYTREHVSQTAVSELHRQQTPTLLGGNLLLPVTRFLVH